MSAERLSLANLEALGSTRAAALWLERLQRDNVGEEDDLFRQWLAASDANHRAWDRAQDLWDSFEEPDEEDLLQGMHREALAFPSRRTAPRWLLYAAAASVALAVSTALLLAPRHGGPQSEPQVAQGGAPRPDLGRFGSPDYATAVGRRASVTLADGTRLELDTDSTVDIAYANGLRLVRLVRGQAFFGVAHDPAHPFRVAAGGRVITALGTRFNIRLAGGETRVLVAEGSVGVSRGDDPTQAQREDFERLGTGQQLIARPGRPDAISKADVEHGAEWRRGILQFDREPLSAAIAELNRYTGDQLIIRDPTVADLRISGTFRTGDTARFARVLSTIYPVRIVPAGNGKLEIVGQP